MAEMTNLQRIPFTFEVDDFQGKAVAFDGDPVGLSSDDTIATVELTKKDDTHWTGFVNATGLVGNCNVTVSVDAAVGSEVDTLVATAEIVVTEDERSKLRVVKLDLGAAENK